MSQTKLIGKIKQLLSEINKVILDKNEEIEMIFAVWLMGGHVLLEDLPGTGKTVLAKCFSKACQVDFGRVQFTPDLLPNDIIGTTIYDQETRKFYFRKGPLFSDFFLADEINRATPRTQAALLESMAEKQITIENRTTELSPTFFVMATQNPLEQHGTFPLPEAQLDRFTIKLSLGFLSQQREIEMIKSQLVHSPLNDLAPVLTQTEVVQLHKLASKVKADQAILEYVVQIADATRNHPKLKHGISPRASLAYTKLAQSYALIKGRDHVIPADIFHLAKPVMSHRLILTEDALFDGEKTDHIVDEILKRVKAPKL
ncbi:MAG: magnesium chelatase [Halobacteriovoraceae bacterium]|nr:magnesium chelatase [Halobacteriovoraceae bacterium]|tara:strand:- start:24253 stop:25197 length:945 start_codon:yes stop_codon:yes gene_type:complete